MPIITFYVCYQTRKREISYDSSMTIRDFLLDFLKKNNLPVINFESDYLFKIGDELLNNKLDCKLEGVIEEDDIIGIYKVTSINLGGGLSTIDVSKNKTKEYEPARSGPSYRQGCNGLNIQSKCKNRNCSAYNDTIYVKIGYVENWNILQHLENQVCCPMCKKMVKPINFWFYISKF